MGNITRRNMMQSGILGTGFLLGGGLSRLVAGSEPSSPSEFGPPYGLDGHPNYKEYKAAKRASRQEIHPVRVDPDNPSILFHDYLCQNCGHCDEVCTDQTTVSHYCKPAVDQGRAVCIQCGQCTNICKRGGMTERIELSPIERGAGKRHPVRQRYYKNHEEKAREAGKALFWLP